MAVGREGVDRGAKLCVRRGRERASLATGPAPTAVVRLSRTVNEVIRPLFPVLRAVSALAVRARGCGRPCGRSARVALGGTGRANKPRRPRSRALRRRRKAGRREAGAALHTARVAVVRQASRTRRLPAMRFPRPVCVRGSRAAGRAPAIEDRRRPADAATCRQSCRRCPAGPGAAACPTRSPRRESFSCR